MRASRRKNEYVDLSIFQVYVFGLCVSYNKHASALFKRNGT